MFKVGKEVIGNLVIPAAVISDVFGGDIGAAARDGEAGIVILASDYSTTVLYHPDADPVVEARPLVILEGEALDDAHISWATDYVTDDFEAAQEEAPYVHFRNVEAPPTYY